MSSTLLPGWVGRKLMYPKTYPAAVYRLIDLTSVPNTTNNRRSDLASSNLTFTHAFPHQSNAEVSQVFRMCSTYTISLSASVKANSVLQQATTRTKQDGNGSSGGIFFRDRNIHEGGIQNPTKVPKARIMTKLGARALGLFISFSTSY